MSRPNTVAPEWLIDLAQQLHQWGIASPLLFLLELHRPLSSTIGSLAAWGQPFFGFMLGEAQAQHLSQWLSTPDGFEQFIQTLERGGPA